MVIGRLRKRLLRIWILRRSNMFTLWMKASIALILGLSVGGALKTRKEIRKGEVQWIAWKGKHDSLYYAKQKQK